MKPLDPVRLARVRELATQASEKVGTSSWDASDFDEWIEPFQSLLAACDPAFILSLLDDARRLEWIADNATSVSDGYGPDGEMMSFANSTHGRVDLIATRLPTVPRETKGWFRAAIDAAIAEDAATDSPAGDSVLAVEVSRSSPDNALTPLALPEEDAAIRTPSGNFFTEVDGLAVHVNRRGCEGEWTAQDDDALAEIVRAAREHFGRKA